MDNSAFGVGINLAAVAAKSMTGISLGGNTIIKSRTVANGFFSVCPTKAVVTTAAQKTALKPDSRLIEHPIQTPQKITGKK